MVGDVGLIHIILLETATEDSRPGPLRDDTRRARHAESHLFDVASSVPLKAKRNVSHVHVFSLFEAAQRGEEDATLVSISRNHA